MKKTLYLLSAALLLMLSACTDNLDLPQKTTYKRVAIIYMAAENSMSSVDMASGKTFVQADLDELASARETIPDSCAVVIYVDDLALPRIYTLTRSGMNQWKEYSPDHNSADSTVMAGVLRDIVTAFPSHSYGLTLWSHGSGWEKKPNRAFASDNQQNTTYDVSTNLTMPELNGVLQQLPHLDYIFFDACYMQTIEVLTCLSPRADYIIGSPAEIPAPGAPYDQIARSLCQADIRDIVTRYAQAYPDERGVVISAVQTSRLSALCSLMAQYIPQYFRQSQMPALDGVQIYYPQSLNGMPVPYDIGSLMAHVLTPEQYQTWLTTLTSALPHHHLARAWASNYSEWNYGYLHSHLTDPDHAVGISMSVPDGRYQSQGWLTTFHALPWYQLTGWAQTGW